MENDSDNGGTSTVSRQSRPNSVDVAWLAGLIDGEGHISFNSCGRHAKSSMKTLIDISMCSQPIVEKAREVIFVLTHKKYPVKERVYVAANHMVYSLRVMDQKGCRKVCEGILPYVVGKREHAEIMIQFCASRQAAKQRHQVRVRGNGRGMAYIEEEKELFRRMSLAKETSYTHRLRGLETKRVAPAERLAG